jgi:hypothetical protein
MMRSGIGAMFDDPKKTQADPVLGEFNPVNPDPETDRPFLHFFRPDLVSRPFHAPEGCGKYQVPGAGEVPYVPEIIDTLRE